MIDLVIAERQRDLGGFSVGRILPFAQRRMVGPFIFLDHMGPIDFPPNIPKSTDVRPHPHIGLSTVTYLFAGEMTHRDSVGAVRDIRPGEVNWMTAGRGSRIRNDSTAFARRVDACMACRLGWPCRRKPRRQIPDSTITV